MARKIASARVAHDSGRESAEVWEVIRTLVLGNADHNRLLELYYWSLEPELLEMVRAFLALPPKVQTELTSYLTRARPRDVSAEIDGRGRLIVSSTDNTGA